MPPKMNNQPPAPFLPLLDHLGSSTADSEWHEWRITRVAGLGNNLLFRATGLTHDLAIKFTIRDARDRAGRMVNLIARSCVRPVARKSRLLPKPATRVIRHSCHSLSAVELPR